jgi:hypothetical protein
VCDARLASGDEVSGVNVKNLAHQPHVQAGASLPRDGVLLETTPLAEGNHRDA